MTLHAVHRWTIGTKLAATFVAVICAVALLISVSMITHERRALDAELRQRGVNLAQNLARLSVDLVLQDDLWRLYTVARDIVQAPGATVPAAQDRIVLYAMVVTPRGELLAHSDPARFSVGEPLPPDSLTGAALGATDVLIQPVVTQTDALIYDIAVPVVLDRQRLATARVGITTRYLEATLARVKREVLLIVSVLAAVGLGLGLAVSRRITRPLAQLSTSVETLSRGQLDRPILVDTVEKDEVGRLADAFNQMARNLRDSVAAMRATQQYLENLLEHANDFIYTVDAGGVLTYVNRKFRELGYEKHDLVGRPLGTLLVDPTRGAWGGEPKAIEVDVRDRAGGIRVWVLTTSLLREPEGRQTGTLGIAKDITERKEMEQRLRDSEKLASVGALAGAMAHEIRNPLGSIVTAVNLLATGPGPADAERQALLKVVQEESRRLSRILGDFLELGRSRPPFLAPHDLDGVVDEVLAALALTERARGKTIRKVLTLRTGRVLVDADQLKQVLWNVALNALEALGDAPGEVVVSTAREDGQVRIVVTDTGPGIARDRLPRVFEPFRTTKRDGMGLGLAIARRIVESHRGHIRVESEPGRGTSVTITVPTDGRS